MGRKRIHPLPEPELTKEELLEYYIKQLGENINLAKGKIEEWLNNIELTKGTIKNSLYEMSRKKGDLIQIRYAPFVLGEEVMYKVEDMPYAVKGVFEIKYIDTTGDAYPCVRLYNKTGELSKKLTKLSDIGDIKKVEE